MLQAGVTTHSNITNRAGSLLHYLFTLTRLRSQLRFELRRGTAHQINLGGCASSKLKAKTGGILSAALLSKRSLPSCYSQAPTPNSRSHTESGLSSVYPKDVPRSSVILSPAGIIPCISRTIKDDFLSLRELRFLSCLEVEVFLPLFTSWISCHKFLFSERFSKRFVIFFQ